MAHKLKLTKAQETLAKGLTGLQRRFAINRMVHQMSQRQAYLAAGGTAKDPDNSASVLQSNSNVKAFTDTFIVEEVQSAIMTRNEALERLTVTAKVTIKDVCDFRNVNMGKNKKGEAIYQTVWTIKNAEDIPDHIAACIKSVAITKNGPKLELHDSHDSIKQIRGMQGWDEAKKLDVDLNDNRLSSEEVDARLTAIFKKAHKL